MLLDILYDYENDEISEVYFIVFKSFFFSSSVQCFLTFEVAFDLTYFPGELLADESNDVSHVEFN